MKLKEILKDNKLLKFSKEADLAIKSGRVLINGKKIIENIELDIIDDFLMPVEDFFYVYIKEIGNHFEDIKQVKLWFKIPEIFDTDTPINTILYQKYKTLFDFCSGFIHLKCGKNKEFILMRSEEVNHILTNKEQSVNTDVIDWILSY